jgi:hypothetical protein
MKPAFKIGKAKKINVDEKGSHLVVKLTGKVPAKIVRELKVKINQAVQEALNPSTD